MHRALSEYKNDGFSMSGNRTRGVCVTGRNVTNYTNTDFQPRTRDLATALPAELLRH